MIDPCKVFHNIMEIHEKINMPRSYKTDLAHDAATLFTLANHINHVLWIVHEDGSAIFTDACDSFAESFAMWCNVFPHDVIYTLASDGVMERSSYDDALVYISSALQAKHKEAIGSTC